MLHTYVLVQELDAKVEGSQKESADKAETLQLSMDNLEARLTSDVSAVRKAGEDSAGDAAMQLAALTSKVSCTIWGRTWLGMRPCRWQQP